MMMKVSAISSLSYNFLSVETCKTTPLCPYIPSSSVGSVPLFLPLFIPNTFFFNFLYAKKQETDRCMSLLCLFLVTYHIRFDLKNAWCYACFSIHKLLLLKRGWRIKFVCFCHYLTQQKTRLSSSTDQMYFCNPIKQKNQTIKAKPTL